MTSELTAPGMTAIDGSVLGPSIPTGEAPPQGDAAPGDGAAPGGEIAPERGRRRRMVLLFLLLAATAALLTIGGWYLLNRKPISELPVPGITVEAVPHYSFSIYDVVAPTGVAVNADGSRIYATQTEGDPGVVVFDGSGNVVGTLKAPATAGGTHVPVYVAVNPTNGDVYVSDRPAATIYIYSTDGAYLRAFDPGPDLAGWAPLGLAFDVKGDLFVTSVGAPFQAVHEFGPDGTFVQTFGKANDFSFPNGVAVDASGNVYVADSNNGRLACSAETAASLLASLDAARSREPRAATRNGDRRLGPRLRRRPSPSRACRSTTCSR